jgi:hypothetical protein
MRARVAYLSSLGTTAILVAAALLMLAVVGAIVAFRAWPDAANGSGVQSVPLTGNLLLGRRAALVVRQVSRSPVVVRTRPVAAIQRRNLSTAGLVKVAGPPTVAGVVKAPGGAGPPVQLNGPGGSQTGIGQPLPAYPAPSGGSTIRVGIPGPSGGGGSAPIVQVQVPTPTAVAPATTQVESVVNHVSAPAPPVVQQVVHQVLPGH